MVKLFNKFCIAIAVLGMLVANLGFAEESSLIIKKISITGNARTEDSTVISYIGLNVGDTYNKEKADAAVKTLYATEFFENVQMTFSNHVLRVNLQENPVINHIHIQGEDSLSEETLLGEISLKPRSFFSKAKLRRDVNRIMEVYNKTGRFAARVRPKIEKLPQNRVNVLFEITENKKAKIRKVIFVGNSHFSSNTLKSVITSKESKIYNLLRMTHYDPDVVDYDKMLLTKFYHDHGYANFKVVSATADVVPSENAFYLTFSLEEGEKFDFGAVKIKNNISSIDSNTLERLVKFKPGQVFSAKLVDITTAEIIKHLSTKGFPFVKVTADYDVNNKGRVVNVIYDISKAAKVYIGRIKIFGNLKTYDYVVRRELRISEGDPYNAFLVNRSEQRIKNLDFFEKVKFDLEKTNNPDVVDLNISVEEKSTAAINLSVGYSTLDGIGGTVAFNESNFLGKGQHLGLRFHKAVGSFSAGFGFSEPNFMNSQLDAGFDLDMSREDNSGAKGGRKANSIPYNRKHYGASVYVNYDITDNLNNTITYSISHDRTSAINDNVPEIVKDEAGKCITSAIGYRLAYDRVDSKIKPTSGYLMTFGQTLAGLGGHSKYISSLLDGSYFYPIKEDIILKLAGSSGYIKGLGRAVRTSDNFNLGEQSFRGFEYGGIGPRDKDPKLQLTSLGGTFYYKGTAEIAFPIPGVPKDLDITASVFSDFGNLMNIEIPKGSKYTKDSYHNSKKIRASVGVGIMWITYLGPLRLDIARAVKKEPFDRTENIHFSMSTLL